MATLYIYNMTEFELELSVNGSPQGSLPANSPGEPVQSSSFPYPANGGQGFATQNNLAVESEGGLTNYSFGLDQDIPPGVDVQISFYQGSLVISEPSGVHLVTASPSGPE